MKVEHLPWELVPGPKYGARELKTRKKWVTVGAWCMSALLIVGGIITPYRIACLFGILYILALMMKKDTVITSRGLEIFYEMYITTHYDFWSWEQIGSVIREDRDHPDLVALHISNGDRAKRLFFTRADAKKIMVLARERNPGIIVRDADKSQMIGYGKDQKNSKKSIKKNKKK